MRLICPRCGAQYEVDDSVIPEAGRDVQCSGCGQTWFQPSAKMIAAEEARREDAQGAPEGWDVAEEPVPEPVSETPPEPAPSARPEPTPNPEPPPAAPEEASIFEAAESPEEEEDAVDWSEPFDMEEDVEPEPSELPPVTTPVIPRASTPEVQAEAEENIGEDTAEAAIAALMQAEQAPQEEPIAEVTAAPEPPPAPEEDYLEPDASEPLLSAERSEVGPAPRVGVVPRRALDENLLAILREEAEREAAARQAEGQSLETQEEMNLAPRAEEPGAQPARTADVMPRRVAPTTPAPKPKPKFEPVVEMPKPPPRPTAPAARQTLDFSDLSSADSDEEERAADLTEGPVQEPGARAAKRLPDIDEINSTLRASADRTGDLAAKGTPQMRAETRSGFRTGFLSVVIVVAALVVLYIFAPRIGAAVPALLPVLETYVAMADTARLLLDGLLRMLIVKLQAAGG
ncbi:putative Zn finger-like uncharacterized protein [Rhodobacter aestuarii]|uniref:MJ0042 family finger-like domain-containing protein n=2 Tax=Rhodobacter aestuarii TaxID=453582 RepID=A0A1N7Q6Q1_9RHOB|nr:zinc-ribbon domain-containing protein [Rhodobacter aestuarii]PTV93843.1 putative Zn finger-like uncharacterized protein [Rhodobacter aestuarii]SIT18525.1 MJ0042 family finger-like domain-containing protein [Rhodobacter aestuarii]